MKILVTDGDNRAALAVTRSLGRAGHEIIVGERRTPSLAAVSRYCRASFVYPDPTTRSDAFVDALAAEVAARRVDVVMPVADITTFVVTGARERFAPPCVVPCAPAAIVERAADKIALVETARRLGVPVPDSVVATCPAPLPEIPWEGPVVIKPQRSRVRTPGGWKSTAVSYAADRAALVRDLSGRPAHDFPVMLQKQVIGPGMGVFACYHAGRPVASFSHRRLRERPPWGGVSVLCESAAVDPIAGAYAESLLTDLGWQGIAMVEFKMDAASGVPVLMEINGRFWGSLQLAIDAGVDFPALLLQTATGEPFAAQPSYRVGVRSRWLWGDLDALLLTLFGGRRVPSTWRRDRLGALLQFARLFGHDLYYDNPKRDDVRPWLLETSRRLGAIAALAGGRASS